MKRTLAFAVSLAIPASYGAACTTTVEPTARSTGAASNVEAGAPSDATPQVDAGETQDSGNTADSGEGVTSDGRCEADAGPAVNPDAAACMIDLDPYDQSCSVDSDCVSTIDLGCAVYTNSQPLRPLYVHGGNFCNGCNCNTALGINRSAVAQYVADVSRTPEGSGQAPFPICNCPLTPPPGTPSCVDGSCQP
jgi:hypothetical protein